MIALIQRVSRAAVSVNDETVGEIEGGLLALIAVQPDDAAVQISRMVQRLISFRVFADSKGRMNLSLNQMNGGLLLVPQFTLAANTDSGNRPSFTNAAPPELGAQRFAELVDEAKQQWPKVATGQFGADMRVELANEGPATFWIEVR